MASSWDEEEYDDDYDNVEQEDLNTETLFQARCIYPFESTCDVEVTIQEGDIINVRSTDAGGGWWEGEINGQVGLFPEQYVERIDGDASGGGHAADSWGDQQQGGAAEDDWGASAAQNQTYTQPEGQPAAQARHGPVPGVPYILDGFQWNPLEQITTVQATINAKKEKKFSGMKTYTTYKITNSASDAVVNHRFKHFDWLHGRLTKMYPCVNVPPLPSKQMQGRFSEDFLEVRRRKLQRFLNRVALHPVLGASSVFRHFLTVGDYKAWKTGKREAEAEASSSNFLSTVDAAEALPGNASDMVALHTRFFNWLERQVVGVGDSHDEILKNQRQQATLYSKMGKTMQKLGNPDVYKESERPNYDLWWAEDPNGNNLKAILDTVGTIGEKLEQFSALVSTQQDQDDERFQAFLQEYQGLLKALNAVTKAHDAAWHELSTAKQKEAPHETIANLEEKCRAVTNVVMAEFRHFHESSVADFRHEFADFCRQNAAFHRRAAEVWDSLADDVEQVL